MSWLMVLICSWMMFVCHVSTSFQRDVIVHTKTLADGTNLTMDYTRLSSKYHVIVFAQW